MSRRCSRTSLWAVAIVCALAQGAESAHAGSTLNVPGEFATIQAAVDAASPGDTVLVAPGTYAGPVNFRSKAITLASSYGPAATVAFTRVVARR